MSPPLESPALATLSLVQVTSATPFRLQSRKTMLALSYLIEDHSARHGKHTLLLATFQRLSLFLPQIERYRAIASQVQHGYVFGVPDVEIPPIENITMVPLEPEWPLVQEWAVIALGPTICAGLFAQDVEGFNPLRRSRLFKGTFTTDPFVIDGVVEPLLQILGITSARSRRNHRAMIESARLLRHDLAERLRQGA